MTMAQQGLPRCKVCNRPLRSAEAIKNGMGHECAKRFISQMSASTEFQGFLTKHNVSQDQFEGYSEEQQKEMIKKYEQHIKRQENPIPTFEQYLLDKGTMSEIEIKDRLERFRDPLAFMNDMMYSKKEEIEMYQWQKEYQSEVVEALSKNYKTFYPTNADYPITVDYEHLSNGDVSVEHVEYDGYNQEIRVFTQIYPDEIDHPNFYEMVTFRKDTNGETIATIETIGVKGGDFRKEIRNPKYDPTNRYQQHLYSIKEDFETQAGKSPDVPPIPDDLNSVFKHGYDCDYPLTKDKYKEYGVDIQGVRYYENSEDMPWNTFTPKAMMAIKLKDEKDGEVDIRYHVNTDGHVVTTIKTKESTANFVEGSKDWLYHPSHLKYHQLLKETHQDFKDMNQKSIRSNLEWRLRQLHNNLQAVERKISDEKNIQKTPERLQKEREVGYGIVSDKVWKEKYESDIARYTVQLDALNNKKDPNAETLRQLVKRDENIKTRMFMERWEWQTERNKEQYKEWYGDNPLTNKVKGYFARLSMKRAGILP